MGRGRPHLLLFLSTTSKHQQHIVTIVQPGTVKPALQFGHEISYREGLCHLFFPIVSTCGDRKRRDLSIKEHPTHPVSASYTTKDTKIVAHPGRKNMQGQRLKHLPMRAPTAIVVVALLAVAISTTFSLCHGFQTPTAVLTSRRGRVMPSSSASSPSSSSTCLNVLPLDTTAIELAQQHAQLLHQQVPSFSDFFQTLSDSASAAAAAGAPADDGWWAAYLNVFKSALLLVHDTIDGPLRSVGWTQTWGVSIFLFTAGTCAFILLGLPPEEPYSYTPFPIARFSEGV
jgi:hypothetical protein